MRKVLLIPCYNEVENIELVIKGFEKYFNNDDIYVFDNASTDGTGDVAKRLNVNVIYSPNRGKGNVVQHMFEYVESDIYVMVDGDLTSFPDDVNLLLDKLTEGYDMVVGDRLALDYFDENKQVFHSFGNRLVRFLIRTIYKYDINDVMSGYRAFNRSFVKSVELTSSGFEIETEMTIWAIEHGCKIACIPVKFQDRQNGSKSKVNTVRDGIKILKFIFSHKKKSKV